MAQNAPQRAVSADLLLILLQSPLSHHLCHVVQAPRQQQQQAVASERSLQDTAAFLEGLFASSYAAQPFADVGDCYEVCGLLLCPAWSVSRAEENHRISWAVCRL